MNLEIPNVDYSKIRRIIISGGWGYGNTGDEAILQATLKLVRSAFPDSKICVSSYTPESTREIAALFNAETTRSIHRRFTKWSSFTRRYQRASSNIEAGCARPSFLSRNTVRAKFKIWEFIGKIESQTLPLRHWLYNQYLTKIAPPKEFVGADLFIQAGGGYFNEDWLDSAYARCIEISIADACGTKSIIFGQTIGPFKQEAIKKHVQLSLRKVTTICVRDPESMNEIAAMGIKCLVAPDTALWDISTANPEKNTITIVYWEASRADHELFSNHIAKYARENTIKLHFVSTRKWNEDIWSTEKLKQQITKQGTVSDYVIPETPNDLQHEIGKGRIIISHNLHGLIIGWRAGIPCVSMNATRKFKGFMKQTNQSGAIIDASTIPPAEAIEIIDTIWKHDSPNPIDLRSTISLEIHNSFLNCIAATQHDQ